MRQTHKSRFFSDATQTLVLRCVCLGYPEGAKTEPQQPVEELGTLDPVIGNQRNHAVGITVMEMSPPRKFERPKYWIPKIWERPVPHVCYNHEIATGRPHHASLPPMNKTSTAGPCLGSNGD